MTSTMQSAVAAIPSVGPYCSARAVSVETSAVSRANSSCGNVEVSGSPPASEITSGRSVSAIISRIAELFIPRVRDANRASYRASSWAVGRAPRPGGVLDRSIWHLLDSPSGRRALGWQRAARGCRLSSCRSAWRRHREGSATGHTMNGLVFYIGLGIGLAAACGLRPFLPVLLAGALGSANVLGVDFPASSSYHFLEAGWWLLAVAVTFALAWAVQILLKLSPFYDPVSREPRRDPLAAALTGLAFGAGAVLFAGTLSAHGDAAWPGVLGGLAVVALAQRVSGPVMWGARRRDHGQASEHPGPGRV